MYLRGFLLKCALRLGFCCVVIDEKKGGKFSVFGRILRILATQIKILATKK